MASTPAAAAAAALEAASELAAQELAGARGAAQAAASAGTALHPSNTLNPSNGWDGQLSAGDPTAMERALEAANMVVDATDFAREQLDAAAAAAAASAHGGGRMCNPPPLNALRQQFFWERIGKHLTLLRAGHDACGVCSACGSAQKC